MINMMKLSFVPQCAEWIHSLGDAIPALAMLVTVVININNIYIMYRNSQERTKLTKTV